MGLVKRHKTLVGGAIFLLLVIGASSSFYFTILKDLPSPTKLASKNLPQSTQIFDRNETLLYTIYAQRNQTFLSLGEIPIDMRNATIAIEDKDFYRHGAIDIRGIIRAAYATLVRKELQGGSTLTQQLVKNSLLTPERTITRKIKEVILAFATELLYPKDKILEMYLNQSPYGGTAYGVEAAAQAYFGKRAKDLTLSESALLAGLPEAPTTYSPFGAYPELAKSRQRQILRKMEEQGYITKEKREQALKKPLVFREFTNNIQAPHFVLFVKDLLVQRYGQRKVEEGGLRVITTLDLPLQEFVQNAVATEAAKLVSYNANNASALVTNPQTGEILGMVGSKNYFDTNIDGNVNVTLALRQPGSAIKPINYAVGLLNKYSAATPFVDQPTCFPNPGHPPYCPLNYDGKWHGALPMRFSLGNSINIPAVKMLKLNGVEEMIATASAMGITTFDKPDRYGLSLTLGGGEVTMLELATAFGVFANQGYRVDLRPILKVVDGNGKVLEEYTPKNSPIFGKKVFPAGVAYIISHILADNGAREMAFGPQSELRIKNYQVSVKTGTTNDFRDNWTIGYTPSILVASWVGNNDNSPMRGLVSGITGAAPIWRQITTHILNNKPPSFPSQPHDVIGKIVCSTSGLLPPPDPPVGGPDRCPTRYELFIRGTEPTKVDPGRQKVLIDTTTGDLAKSGQTENVEERDELVVTDPLGDRYCITCPHPEPEKK